MSSASQMFTKENGQLLSSDRNHLSASAPSWRLRLSAAHRCFWKHTTASSRIATIRRRSPQACAFCLSAAKNCVGNSKSGWKREVPASAVMSFSFIEKPRPFLVEGAPPTVTSTTHTDEMYGATLLITPLYYSKLRPIHEIFLTRTCRGWQVG